MISTTKLSARTVLRAVKAAIRLYQSKASQGKQSVRTLLRQNRGVSSVEISKTGIRGLECYAKKYGIDYAIRKDTSEVPPRYLVFFKAPDAEAFHSAFKEYSASVLDKTKPSFRSWQSCMIWRSPLQICRTKCGTSRRSVAYEQKRSFPSCWRSICPIFCWGWWQRTLVKHGSLPRARNWAIRSCP